MKLQYYLLIFSAYTLLVVTSGELNMESPLVCANSFNKDFRQEENVRCKTLDLSASIDFDCNILLNYKLVEKKIKADVIKTKLVLSPPRTDLNETVFIWEIEQGEAESHHYRNNLEGIPVKLSYDHEYNVSYSEVVLYDIKYDVLYRICANVPGAFDDPSVCCRVEHAPIEEDTNIYMCLIVIAILLVMYAIIMVVFWRCSPSSYRTLEEMLSSLPSSHVERLKSLVVDQAFDDEDEDDEDEESDIESDSEAKRKPRVRIDSQFTEIGENPAYEASDDDNDEPQVPPTSSRDKRRASRVSFATAKEDDIEYNLRKEAQKLRRLSRVSLGSIKVPPKGVKFAESETVINLNDIEDLKIKIFNESKRRASVKPFKKPFDLEISDSD